MRNQSPLSKAIFKTKQGRNLENISYEFLNNINNLNEIRES